MNSGSGSLSTGLRVTVVMSLVCMRRPATVKSRLPAHVVKEAAGPMVHGMDRKGIEPLTGSATAVVIIVL